MGKYNIGDVVICVDNPNRRKNAESGERHKGRGSGWKLGRIMKITEFSGTTEQQIIWDKNRGNDGYKGCGVWEDSVVLASWKNRVRQ